MFNANTQLQVSDLTFDGIKNNFKNFIKTKTEFEDYNFEGSTIGYVIDILAYDTYMKSIYTNLAVNETFVDTAQVRSNLVSLAKPFGYVPKSAAASTAKVIVTFSPNDDPTSIVIPAGTLFDAVKDGVKYTFVTNKEYNAVPNFGQYTAIVEIEEGNLIRQTFTYNSSKLVHELANDNIDISSLKIGVRENVENNLIDYYTRADDITNVRDNSKIYFLQENNRGNYEFYFGDNILGLRPEENSEIIAEYVVCSGKAANDIQKFNAVGYTGYNISDLSKRYTTSSVITTEASSFGADKEDIESIRFNSLNNYPIQGRLVTKKDYENYVKIQYNYIESINVWGGEDNVPPLYGKTILCLKPYDGYALTQEKKEEIVTQMKSRNVLSIDPIIVDPTFTFIVPDITVYFDSTKTVSTSDTIYNNVIKSVKDFEASELSNFDKVFRYSSFVRAIDKSDQSIISNKTVIKYEKRFVPIINTTMTYKIKFDTAIYHPYDGYVGGLKSSEFRINTTNEILHIEDNGYGSLDLVYFNGRDNKFIFKKGIGTVDYTNGTIALNALHVTQIQQESDIEIKIQIEIQDYDLEPKKSNILLLSSPTIRILDTYNRQILNSGVVNTDGDISPIYTSNIAY